MTEGIYFADAELPFHVWVRERAGTTGFRWVLRERGAATSAPAEADSQRAPDGADGSADGARKP
jgi:hypothetical protein